MSTPSNPKVRRVKIEKLVPGMVVANDVINEAGIIFVAKNSILTNSILSKLIDNNISSIYIRELDPNAKTDDLDIINERNIPVTERKNFKEFSDSHEKASEEIKHVLLDIGDGGQINLERLYTLTNGVMSQLKYKSDIFSYLHSLKDKDEHTFAHSTNVSLLANLFGGWLHLEEEELLHLTTAATLHDIGKTKIPDEILNKKGKLTPEEFEIMKLHTVYGYRLMETQDIPLHVKLPSLLHHEKIDGTGYPIGMKADQISKFAKIISICDIYDAMTANRIYRAKLCPFDVIKNFEQSSYGQMDTAYLITFLQNIAYTYIGSHIVLSDDREGEVVFINPNNLSLPIVRIGAELIDLSTAKDLKINSVIGT